MQLTEEERSEIKTLLKMSVAKNKKQYNIREKAFYHKIKEKYGEKIASEMLRKLWKAKLGEDYDD